MAPNDPEKYSLPAVSPTPYVLQMVPPMNMTFLSLPIARSPIEQRRRLLNVLREALDLIDDCHADDDSQQKEK